MGPARIAPISNASGLSCADLTPEARPREGQPPVILARGRDTGGHFQLVQPPTDVDAHEALRGMREAAARHFAAMLSRIATKHR